MKVKQFFLLMLVILFCVPTMAQIKVTGTVTDGQETIIGATVVVKGATGGTVTDLDGRFTINVPSAKSHIVITSIGYKSQDIVVGNRTHLDIVLQEDSKMVDEVVVVGYGSMKKSDLSGAVGQIKSDDLLKGGAVDLGHGLQGKMAGVQINQSDGATGAGLSSNVRGAN